MVEKSYYNGVEEDIKGPKDATKKGIAIIHQELNLITRFKYRRKYILRTRAKKSFW